MSISRVFSVIGDRNVRDHMTTLNIASREAMKGAEVLSCPSLSNLATVFSEIRSGSHFELLTGLRLILLSRPPSFVINRAYLVTSTIDNDDTPVT